MNILSIIADIAGILSFLIGVGTLVVALRIRNKILSNVEKSDYIQEIDSHIKNLLSYCETIKKDELYTSELLDTIDIALDDLQIAYGTILPKDLSSLIKKLRNHIKFACQKNIKDEVAKRDCAKQLHTIASKLRKEKKVLW